jgi:hypothetical protein
MGNVSVRCPSAVSTLFAMAKASWRNALSSRMEKIDLNRDLGGWQVEFRAFTYGSVLGSEFHRIVTGPPAVEFFGVSTVKPATKGARRARRLRVMDKRY